MLAAAEAGLCSRLERPEGFDVAGVLLGDVAAVEAEPYSHLVLPKDIAVAKGALYLRLELAKDVAAVAGPLEAVAAERPEHWAASPHVLVDG